jgi:hypothetical protein
VQLLLGQVAGVGLGDRTRLHRRQGCGDLLDLTDHLDQLVIRPRRPQHLGQPAHRRRGVGQDVCGGGAGGELRDRHKTMQSPPTDIPTRYAGLSTGIRGNS